MFSRRSLLIDILLNPGALEMYDVPMVWMCLLCLSDAMTFTSAIEPLHHQPLARLSAEHQRHRWVGTTAVPILTDPHCRLVLECLADTM